MDKQLKVVKTDGSTEDYLHTKVIGTISKALAAGGYDDIMIADSLSEVITYFLYQKQKHHVTSNEIFSLIKIILASTGYMTAAAALEEYHYTRKLKRSRLDVILADIKQLVDIETAKEKTTWNKSVIADDLVTKYRIDRLTARTIASMVEENIMKLTINPVPTSLIKQFVFHETAAFIRAQKQLQDC